MWWASWEIFFLSSPKASTISGTITVSILLTNGGGVRGGHYSQKYGGALCGYTTQTVCPRSPVQPHPLVVRFRGGTPGESLKVVAQDEML